MLGCSEIDNYSYDNDFLKFICLKDHQTVEVQYLDVGRIRWVEFIWNGMQKAVVVRELIQLFRQLGDGVSQGTTGGILRHCRYERAPTKPSQET